MSDFETVALIVIFLVVSAIIVRLIGGDADREPRTASVSRAAQPPPEIRTASVSNQAQRAAVAPQAARVEPPKPRPIEPAMVKVDIPPPTQIPTARPAAQQQTAAQTTNAKTAAPSPVTIVKPNAAGTITPANFVAYVPPAPPKAVEQSAPKPDPKPAPQLNLGPITLSKPDIKATVAPGATLAAPGAAPARYTPARQLSPEDQAILSRYQRPDVKATLYREAATAPASAPASPAATSPAASTSAAATAAKTAPAPAPTSASTTTPAPAKASEPPAPSGTSEPSAAATLPPGYQRPAPIAKAPQVGPATGYAPLGIRPDADATIEGASAKMEAAEQPAAPTAKTLSASAAPAPAHKTTPLNAATYAAATGTAAASATRSQPRNDAILLSTAKRGTRVVGLDGAENGVIELDRPAAGQTIRAERVSVRAETLLVRPDATNTIDPSAPKYTSIPKAPPVTSQRPASGATPDSAGHYANVRFTLPPGSLGTD